MAFVPFASRTRPMSRIQSPLAEHPNFLGAVDLGATWKGKELVGRWNGVQVISWGEASRAHSHTIT